MKADKINKILGIVDGNILHASSRIRLYDYCSLFSQNDVELRIIARTSKVNRDSVLNKLIFFILKRTLLIKRLFAISFSRFEIIFVQRNVLSGIELRLIEARKKTLIFDFDDAIYVNSKKPSTEYKVKRIIQKAHLVLVGNETLHSWTKKYNSNTHIIPTPVDVPTNINFSKSNSPITIGWIGSPWTQSFLSPIKSVFSELRKEGLDFQLFFVGVDDNFQFNSELGVFIPWEQEIEADFLSKIDIGIMPITENAFSTGKSGYKLLLYMSAGKACIASPVGVNNEIINHGNNGYLASSTEEWKEAITMLLQNPKKRIKFGKASHQMVLEKFDKKVVFSNILQKIKETHESRNI